MHVRLGTRDRHILGTRSGRVFRATLIFLVIVGGYLWYEGFFVGSLDFRSEAEKVAAFKKDPIDTLASKGVFTKCERAGDGRVQAWIGDGWFVLDAKEKRGVCLIALSRFSGTPLLTDKDVLTLNDRNGHVGVYRKSTGLVMDP